MKPPLIAYYEHIYALRFVQQEDAAAHITRDVAAALDRLKPGWAERMPQHMVVVFEQLAARDGRRIKRVAVSEHGPDNPPDFEVVRAAAVLHWSLFVRAREPEPGEERVRCRLAFYRKE